MINVGPLAIHYQKAVWLSSALDQIISDHRARVVNPSNRCSQRSRNPDRLESPESFKERSRLPWPQSRTPVRKPLAVPIRGFSFSLPGIGLYWHTPANSFSDMKSGSDCKPTADRSNRSRRLAAPEKMTRRSIRRLETTIRTIVRGLHRTLPRSLWSLIPKPYRCPHSWDSQTCSICRCGTGAPMALTAGIEGVIDNAATLLMSKASEFLLRRER